MSSHVSGSCDTYGKAKQDAVPTVAYAVAYNTSSYYLDQAYAQNETLFNFVGRAVTDALRPDSSSGNCLLVVFFCHEVLKPAPIQACACCIMQSWLRALTQTCTGCIQHAAMLLVLKVCLNDTHQLSTKHVNQSITNHHPGYH